MDRVKELLLALELDDHESGSSDRDRGVVHSP